MRYPSVIAYAAICLALAACWDAGKPHHQPSVPVLAPNQSFLRVTTERPADMPAMFTTTAPCSLDALNDQPARDVTIVADKARIKVVGWAGNMADGTSPQEVWLEFNGVNSGYVRATRGGKRPDVAKHFNKSGLTDSGWKAFVDLSSLASGTYKVHVIMTDRRQAFGCDTKRAVRID